MYLLGKILTMNTKKIIFTLYTKINIKFFGHYNSEEIKNEASLCMYQLSSL